MAEMKPKNSMKKPLGMTQAAFFVVTLGNVMTRDATEAHKMLRFISFNILVGSELLYFRRKLDLYA